MVRLKDIAVRAGVSVMTVSKVMRDAPDISAATKARVRLLAGQMGYVPDRMAQSLRSRKTQLFGIVMSAATNPIFARMLNAIEERAFQMDCDVIFAHSLNQEEREETIIRRMMARRVDGLFLYPVYRMEEAAPVYEELRRAAIPTVVLGHPVPFCAAFTTVAVDDQGAAKRMTRHLIELGHRRIAFLTGPRYAPWSTERLEGYRTALRDAGIEFDDSLVFSGGATIESGAAAALQFINEDCRATAVQAVNDLVAIGAAGTLIAQGVEIPRQLSIAGFGNVLTSEHFQVPLTTVRQPKFRLGVAAMEIMKKLLAGEPAESVRLTADIVVRKSTGAPPTG